MMPRPSLPRAKEIAEIAKSLRAEGFSSICIESCPDGRLSITASETVPPSNDVTPLQKWKAARGVA